MAEQIVVPSTVPAAANQSAYVAAVNKVDQAARAEADRANGNANADRITITADERAVLVERASNDANSHKLSETARNIANHVAGALAAVEPPGTEPPFQNDSLNKIYSAQQRYTEYLANRAAEQQKATETKEVDR